jgi:anti-anti-sigma factor
VLVINSTKRGGAVVILLKGSLMSDRTMDVEKVFHEEIQKGPRAIGFNLKDLVGLDSSGLGLFMRLRKEAVKNHVDLVFFNITESIIALFDISKLSNFITVMSEDAFSERYTG